MATGLAAVTAAITWVRNQWGSWQAQRRERKRRNWHCIDVSGINTGRAAESWRARASA